MDKVRAWVLFQDRVRIRGQAGVVFGFGPGLVQPEGGVGVLGSSFALATGRDYICHDQITVFPILGIQKPCACNAHYKLANRIWAVVIMTLLSKYVVVGILCLIQKISSHLGVYSTLKGLPILGRSIFGSSKIHEIENQNTANVKSCKPAPTSDPWP